MNRGTACSVARLSAVSAVRCNTYIHVQETFPLGHPDMSKGSKSEEGQAQIGLGRLMKAHDGLKIAQGYSVGKPCLRTLIRFSVRRSFGA